MRSEILTDFHELIQAYEWVFMEEVRNDDHLMWKVAGILVERGELEDIDVPSVEDCLAGQFKGPIICRNGSKDSNDLCSIVGITYGTWKSYVNSCLKGAKKDGVSFVKPASFQELRPLPIEGGSQYGGPFELGDVIRLRLNREVTVVEDKGERTLTKYLFLPKSLLSLRNPDPFVPLLRDKIRDVLTEIEETRDAIFEHPTHIPRSNEEVVQGYSSVVTNVVRRHFKFGLPLEDAISEVWLKLLTSDLTKKFLNTATKHFPTTLTVDEAVEFLGVSWDAWCAMVDNYDKAPTPIKGSAKDPAAMLESEAILILDREGYFKQRHDLRRLPEACVTLARFENYLRVAANNHTKNLLRTQDRRFNKELTQGPSVLSKTGDVFKRSVAVDENMSWETTLRSEDPLIDEVLDGHFIARALLAQRLGVPYKSPEYYEQVDTLLRDHRVHNPIATMDDVLKEHGLDYGSPEYYQEVQNLAQAAGGMGGMDLERGLCIIRLLSEGYTHKEAIQKQREFERQQSGQASEEVNLVRVAV